MEITFSKKFYDKKEIVKTMEIFEKEKVGAFELNEDADNYIVIGKNIGKEDQAEVKDEFGNFLISLMR